MFKKIVGIIILICLCFAITSCGENKRICIESDTYKVYKCNVYGQYGLFNINDMKNKNIQYRVIIGNIIYAVLLCQTIIVPVIVLGWYLYEPVGLKNENEAGVVQ